MKLTKIWLRAHSACASGYEYAVKELIGLTEKDANQHIKLWN
jgi:hypothetical protein